MADNGDADDAKSDVIGAITKGFDQYEYVAVIVPGATLLFGVSLVLPDRLWTFDKDLGIGAAVILLIGAYIAGHVLRAIGDLAEPWLWKLRGGMPTEWVTREQQKLLDQEQKEKLTMKVRSLLGNSAIRLSDYKSKPGEWQAVTRRIYAKVKRGGHADRVDVFNRTLGMMSGVTVALLLICLLFALKSWRAGVLLSQTTLWSALALIAAALTLHRFYAFGVYYARELFVEFLEV